LDRNTWVLQAYNYAFKLLFILLLPN